MMTSEEKGSTPKKNDKKGSNDKHEFQKDILNVEGGELTEDDLDISGGFGFPVESTFP